MFVRRRVHGRPAVPSTQLVHWWQFVFFRLCFLHNSYTGNTLCVGVGVGVGVCDCVGVGVGVGVGTHAPAHT
jgi:hypothetical protein